MVHDSFAGNITFPKAQPIRDAAQMVPLDRMLIETDSPTCAPPHRGKRNEPAFVAEVARQIAELHSLSTEEVGAQTTRNFYKFFGLDRKLQRPEYVHSLVILSEAKDLMSRAPPKEQVLRFAQE